VDYEMSGKDLLDSVTLSGQICRMLGGTPPDTLTYEMFLDEHGAKISKSKGNGIAVEDWLTYAPPESLAFFMYQRPKAAKRLHFDMIPRTVDDYLAELQQFQAQETRQRLNTAAELARSAAIPALWEPAMPPTEDSRHYVTHPGDARLYGAGHAEFMRRSNLRLHAAALIAARIADHVHPSQATTRILDLGCHDGAMTSLYLTELLKRSSAQVFQVTVVDPAAEALATVAARLAGLGARVQPVCLNITAESYVHTMAGPYDVITALWLFYHIQPEAIGGFLGMLAQPGLLLVAMGSPTHPIKSYGPLAHLSRHGDSQPVETCLVAMHATGLLTFDRLVIPTQIDLNGLWEKGIGVTEVGKAFFSFLFNRDVEQFLPDEERALATLLEGIMRDQAGIVSHDHFLYVIRPLHERR
jgi:SAM-dependent methyltransferase